MTEFIETEHGAFQVIVAEGVTFTTPDEPEWPAAAFLVVAPYVEPSRLSQAILNQLMGGLQARIAANPDTKRVVVVMPGEIAVASWYG